MQYTLKQVQHPMLRLQPEHERVRPSVTRALYHKLIKWVEKSKVSTMFRTACKIGIALIIGVGVFYPSETMDAVVDILQWNSYKLSIYLTVMAVVMHWRRVARAAQRLGIKRAGANQHTFEGIPVDNLATFLFERGAFKRDEAMGAFGLSRDKYDAIGTKLENAAVLTRGDCNARVINPHMTREELVRQLRDDFPLVYDESRKEWVERTGGFARWILDKERAEQKGKEKAERLERRVDRAKEQLAELTGAAEMGFTQRTLTLV